MPQHFLSVVGIFMNEGHIMEEWIEHYLSEGVDHFYLIDNGSTDNYIDIINKYSHKITLVIDDTKNAQTFLYNKYFFSRKNESSWILICDLDEFVYGTTGSIKDALLKIDHRTVGEICIPWGMFGSSHHIHQPNSVVKNFIYRQQYLTAVYDHCKTIVNSNALLELSVHRHIIDKSYLVIDDLLNIVKNDSYMFILSEDRLRNAVFRLNHYAIQSLNWFKEVKMTRGDVASSNLNSVRDMKYFGRYDHNDIKDTFLYEKHKRVYDEIDKTGNSRSLESFSSNITDSIILNASLAMVFMLFLYNVVIVWLVLTSS